MSLKQKQRAIKLLRGLEGTPFYENALFNEINKELETAKTTKSVTIFGKTEKGKDGYTPIKGKDYFDGEKGKDGTSVELKDVLEKLRPELYSKIYSLIPHGGNANRNIAVGGNASVLSKYGDINFKAGNNITLSYSNNDTTKLFDLTIASTGLMAIRSITTLSVSSTIGAIASTDQVFVCNAGIQVTLPTAVGDTNLYTIKNTAASSVFVGTTASQTIDGVSSKTLATQYTSIDLVSDGSNWDLT